MTEFQQFALTEEVKPIKRKKNSYVLEKTMIKLRQIHDELNSVLYNNPSEAPAIIHPSDAYDVLRYFLETLDHEEFWIMVLNARNRLIKIVKLYQGTQSSSQIRIAEVFRQAIILNAASIIIAHNHPSGDPTPSPEDMVLTKAIKQAGDLLGVDLMDHLVIGSTKYASMKERGLIP